MKPKNCKYCERAAVARGMCHGHLRRYNEGKRGEDLESPIRNYSMGEVDLLDDSGPPVARLAYDKEWEAFAGWIGMSYQRRAPVPARPKQGPIVHGVLSDLHVPFHSMEAIVEGVQWFSSQGVQEVWLGGDVADHYSLSRFSQYEHIGIQQEAIEVRKVLDLLSRAFPMVHVISGNHESRERKYLSSRLPADLLNWFLAKSFMERLTEDMENVTMEKRMVEGTALHWITPVGKDAIIAHAESASKIALRPADNVRQWMDNWHEVLDLTRPAVIMQAHTHQSGMARVGRRVILELGCTCKIQAYALEPRLYGKPQTQAATVFHQTDGVTDLNSIQQRYLCL